MYNLPPLPVRKKPRPPHYKSAAIKKVEALANADAQRKHPNIDPRFLAPRKYSDRDANGLTRAVIDFLNLSGHLAERINVTGRYQDNSQTFEDVTGKVRTIGTGQWLPTSGMKGSADVSATIRGKSVKIEIKMKDKQSEDQRKYQERIEAAGGLYWLVRSFDEFRQQYDNYLNKD